MERIPEIPDDYTLDGGYGGYSWSEENEEIDDIIEDVCPKCSSLNVHRNKHDFLVCDDCGYEEVPASEMGVCERCGADTPMALLTNGLCPACIDDLEEGDEDEDDYS